MKVLNLLPLLLLSVACGGEFGGKTADEYFAKSKPIENAVDVQVVEGSGQKEKEEQADQVAEDLSLVTEIFSQSSRKQLDLVWIIDNSGSMSDEQAALGANFDAFIKDFVDTEVDFKMAITTTDVRDGKKGVIVPGSDTKLTSVAAKSNRSQFISDFNSLIQVGISGSGSEQGLKASEGFVELNGASFIRPDAYLVFVILSDEEDQSEKTPLEYINFLKSTKSLNPGLVKMYSIVDTTESNSGNGVTVGYKRYAEASNLTGGEVANIRGDFSQMLAEMGDSIMSLLDSFAISSAAVPGSLKVYVNGSLVNQYTFDEKSRSVKFHSDAIPPVGAEVKISYQKLSQ